MKPQGHSARPSPIPVAILLLLASFGATAGSKSSNLLAQPPAAGSMKLELRLGDGRTEFHLGEVIPVELTFTSTERRKYQIMAWECGPRVIYVYSVEPPAFTDRALDLDAAMKMDGMSCGGPTVEVDPGEKPFKVQQTLNGRFRIDTPGKYRISVTSCRFGFPVVSNTVEFELRPRDAVWEKTELARGIALLGSPPDKPEQTDGCSILRFLGTDAAELEMARRYVGRGPCDDAFSLGLINARNRQAVLGQLEAGLAEPERGISQSYLRTLAIVSLYENHPEWYPQASKDTGQAQPSSAEPSMRSGLWTQHGAIARQELHYASALIATLPQKAPAARAYSLETLLDLGNRLPGVELPPEFSKVVRDQMPSVFEKLPAVDQDQALMHRWPDLDSPAMIPVLKRIIESEWQFQPSGIALRRLYELSPEEGRPYLLRQLQALRDPQSDPRVEVDVLGLLPGKEFPEFDAVMLDRVKERFQYDDGILVYYAELVERFASPAIAISLRTLLDQHLGKMQCQAEANLVAYFLRVAPEEGAELLHRAMRAPRCQSELLEWLAGVRMSPEVEAAALAALDDPENAVVLNALLVLQKYASINSRAVLLQYFRQWHKTWAPRVAELERPENQARMSIDQVYFLALATAQAWLSSKQDMQALRELCVTKACREKADQTIDYWTQMKFMVQMSEPSGFNFVEHFGIAHYYSVGDMDRLKQKMAQYPRGSVFLLDPRIANYNRVQQVCEQLNKWATERGYEVKVYREQATGPQPPIAPVPF